MNQQPNDQPICQSCGMPMTEPEHFATNRDGSASQDYCAYCMKDGAFTHDMTMEEVIELNLQWLDEFNKDAPVPFTVDQARAEMLKFFPSLKRWKKQANDL